MDAWCALWLWPLDKADLLPGRAEFLQGMAMILEGGFTADGSLADLVFSNQQIRFGFAKSDKANLSVAELKVYRKAASIMLELGDDQIETEVEAGRLVEVNDDEQG